MATGQGPIYDDSVTFPTNKDDGGALPTLSDYVASECNAQGTFNYAARTAIRGGIYHGATDQSAALPPLSSGTPGALSTNWTSNGGQLATSEVGGPYVWIRNVEYVNLGDKRFGLKGNWNGTTGTPDDAALAAALTACINISNTDKRRVLSMPSAAIRLTQPLTVTPSFGFVMKGEGIQATQFYLDPATPNANGMVIQSSQDHRYEGFALMGRKANPAGKALLVDNTVMGFTSGGHVFSDININCDDDHDGFDIGIEFTVGSGNNSEMTYRNVRVWRYKTAALHLIGSQQYGHSLSGCNIQGIWDGISPSANGGQYGIWCEGGQFVLSGQNSIGSHRTGDYFISSTSDLPCIINNVDSEHSYAITPGAGSLVATAGAINVLFTNNRFAFDQGSFNPNGVLAYAAVGACIIEGNSFFTTSGANFPKIAFAPGNAPRGCRVRGNVFNTPNSVSIDPIVIEGTSLNYRQMIDARDNIFVDGSGNVAYRNEHLNIPNIVGSVVADCTAPTTVPDVWEIDLTTFNAAATSQIKKFTDVPALIVFTEIWAFLHNYVTTSTGATISMKVGITSGGNELMTATTLGGSGVGDEVQWYGPFLSAPVMANMLSVTGSIYVTLTASTGNLGNGTVSNITRGIVHIAPVYRLQSKKFT